MRPLPGLSVKHLINLFFPKSINFGFDSYAGASCYILGQHSLSGPAASLHMLSIPWQVFVMCFL